MADQYIDDDEIQEYTRGFYTSTEPLVGKSKLVDVGAVRELVRSKAAEVAANVVTTGTERSELRGTREGTRAEDAVLRDLIERTYFFTRSLPITVKYDINALYPGGSLGELSTLKPADLVAKADEVLRGFAVPANKAIPGAAERIAELLAARNALANKLEGRGSSQTTSVEATAELVAARKAFFAAYHHIAKPLIRGVLVELGRSANEYRRYFPDLLVNEDAPPRTPPGSGEK